MHIRFHRTVIILLSLIRIGWRRQNRDYKREVFAMMLPVPAFGYFIVFIVYQINLNYFKMAMTVIDCEKEYHIKWDYHPRLNDNYLQDVKKIGIYERYEKWELGRKVPAEKFQRTAFYIPEGKYWSVPKDQKDQVFKLVQKWKANVITTEDLKPIQIGVIPPLPELRETVNIKGTFRHYQSQGVQRMADLKRVINGDEMGLGKTLQSIGTIEYTNTFPCIVICPATVKVNWQREWHKWTNRKAVIMDDDIKDNWLQVYHTGMADVFITNYESIKKFFVKYIPPKKKVGNREIAPSSKDIIMDPTTSVFKSIIIDELHKCKDGSTIRTKLVGRLAQGKDIRIGLTGTMLVNKPKDIYPQLAIIGAAYHFGDEKRFLNRYCEGGSGASNLKELNYLLNKHCFFRRKKADVAKELPPKIRQNIACDITTREEYNKAKNNFLSYLQEQGLSDEEIIRKMNGEVMVQLMKLKEISARGKMESVREFLEEIIAEGNKVVIFANLHIIVDEVFDMFPKMSVKITGLQNIHQKQAAIDAFQNDPSKLIAVVNIKTGGVGIELTAAHHVAFVEWPYHPADCVQCEDRCHRLTTTETVFAHYFLGLNTVDERSFEIIRDKADLMNQALGDNENMNMKVSMDLLKAIRG